MYTINVLIVTYKQEKLIGRAIESAIKQKDWGLKNIVIRDDCSPDNNWQVIQKYKDKYPDIIIAHQNEHNMGIYGNYFNVNNDRGEADLYYYLEGDDEIVDGWFEAVQHYLKDNMIDLTGNAAIICSDYKIIRPNGMSYTNRNNRLVRKKINHLSLKSRTVVHNRSVLISSATFNRFEPLLYNQGLAIAEEMNTTQPYHHSDYFYYVPFIASIYYTHIGISTRLNSDDYFQDRIKSYNWMKGYYSLDKKARLYKDFQIAQCEFQITPSWKNYFYMRKLFWKSFDRYTLYGARFMLETLSWSRMVKLLICGKKNK